MDAYDLMTEKIKYNQWANSSLISWLKDQPVEVHEHDVKSSFPNVNKLLHHMMDAQTYYLSILQVTEGNYEEELPTDKVFDQLIELDKQLVAWFSNKKAGLLDQKISLKRSPVVETYTVATLITHMINHSTYHRGQLVAMRHQLGISEPPKTDYYRYFIYSGSN
jgi:uncharacterized damage-inducible protein DinB